MKKETLKKINAVLVIKSKEEQHLITRHRRKKFVLHSHFLLLYMIICLPYHLMLLESWPTTILPDCSWFLLILMKNLSLFTGFLLVEKQILLSSTRRTNCENYIENPVGSTYRSSWAFTLLRVRFNIVFQFFAAVCFFPVFLSSVVFIV